MLGVAAGDAHPSMYIGQLSALTGASRKAIRLYESLGLIPQPQRRGTYRVYTDQHVHMVQMIRRSLAAGFALSEMLEVMTLKYSTGRFPVALVQHKLADKLERLREQKAAIERIEQDLVRMQGEVAALYGDVELSEPCADTRAQTARPALPKIA